MRRLSKILVVLYLITVVNGVYSLADPNSEKSQPFNIQVTKFGTLDGGTNTLRINEQQNGLIETPAGRGHGGFVSSAVFRGWVEKYNPHFIQLEARLTPSDVIEVKGEYDKADRPLTAMGIAHTTIGAHKLVNLDLSDCKVLVVNCAGKVPKAALQKVRDFVANGGALLTTDWSLHNLLERSFPGYVRWNGGRSGLEVVDAQVTSLDPTLAHGVVSRSGWKLDDASQTIAVLNPEQVRILARSTILARQDPDRQGILAVSFRFGRGRVLHLIGHFDNNAFLHILNVLPDPAPVIGISLRQALAANFIINALEQACEPTGVTR